MLRPGNAGANTAADHKTVLDRALELIPAEHIETLEILVRADSAGATHELARPLRSVAQSSTESFPTAFAQTTANGSPDAPAPPPRSAASNTAHYLNLD
jgi:hypothetical protein